MPIDLDNLVAEPGFAPRAWQSKCPDDAYESTRVPVQPSPELQRIVALPRRMQPTKPEEAQLVAFMSAQMRRERAPDDPCRCDEIQRSYGLVDPKTNKTLGCILSLKPVQAWALLEIRTKAGLLGPIGVGHGKTMLDLLAPLVMPNCKSAALLVPPGLVKQLIREYLLMGQHFRMPSLITHDANAESRIVPGAPILHVFPYSRLSRPESTDYLERVIKPDTIIADEVHKLKSSDTATTSRVLRYFANHPETRFCGWSGSLTDKSIKDYAHLSALALRMDSPLPIDPEVVEDWARAIDPNEARAPEGALTQLCEEGEHYLHAFHRRLVETAGVVATRTAAVDAKLVIEEKPAPPIPKTPPTTMPPFMDSNGEPVSLAKAIFDARYRWKRPDGEKYPDALQRQAGLLQLACGFFYRWRFPPVKGQPQSVATILEFLDIRAMWCKEVRAVIKSRREHFDSERLARNAAERYYGHRPVSDKKLPVWGSRMYQDWYRIENAVVYETEPVWIDDVIARDTAQWALEHRGIVWYDVSAFGEKVAKLSGLPMFGGGKENEKLISEYDGRTSIIASIKSHGTGRDGLQLKYDEQFVPNPGSSNEEWEQLLGRLHRVRQLSHTVRTLFYRHTPELIRCVNQALRRSGYVQGTMGSDQKLVLAGLEMVDPPDDGTDTDDDEE